MNGLFLGIDTSCYTTSVCIVDENGHIIVEERQLLTVPSGKRGLAQSNMVFQHTKNLPVLFRKISNILSFKKLTGIAVTGMPRRLSDSYMPAFLVGRGYGESLAAGLHLPLAVISHQENHIFAALRTHPMLWQDDFYALHVSGGTTDLLKVSSASVGLAVSPIGHSLDIQAGQFIDRVGVALEIPFPAGPALEELAASWNKPVQPLQITVNNGLVSFSGPESQLQRFIQQQTYSPAVLAKMTMETISKGICDMLAQTIVHTPIKKLVAVGGVMANRFLHSQLTEFLAADAVTLYVTESGYSTDNASGAAYYASRMTNGG